MQCSCGNNKRFGTISPSSGSGNVFLIGTFPGKKHIGAVAIHVCADCGILLSDMRGNVGEPIKRNKNKQ